MKLRSLIILLLLPILVWGQGEKTWTFNEYNFYQK